jgi:hypothetical protein
MLTREERWEHISNITNAATAVMGYLDLIQHPEQLEQLGQQLGKKIDKDECIGKALQQAERVMKSGTALRMDAWEEKKRNV